MKDSFLSDYDVYLFSEGTHYRTYEKLGAHPTTLNGTPGVNFCVWAPNANQVSLVGDFNGWSPGSHCLKPRASSGLWELFVPDLPVGSLYKYHIQSNSDGYTTEKADPYGFAAETRPQTATRVWDVDAYQWSDADWMKDRKHCQALDAPISIYEVHLGSWRRRPEDGNRWLSYRELAAELTEYIHQMGFTHVEFLPVSEHPFDGSWGYQTVGYFAPTSRYGSPDDFKYLVDVLHQHGIGVILDWVPAHFPTDSHGLAYFDGTHLFEHSDPRQREHRDWGTYIFNYGRTEVANFLISNALFWLDKYHIDGLRVDAVASMLYLDYSREEHDWIPNEHGGRENLNAISFLQRFNEVVYQDFPDAITFAEESTSWPMVSKPTYLGGLGFGMKWDMGWMHDMLEYISHDPVHRKFHHNNLTFRMLYAFSENFTLPLSHDEVVHGKRALLSKMPGDDWQKFANLRLLLGTMFAQPGKKLLFMGGEFGMWDEWDHDQSISWHLLEHSQHQGLQRWVRDMNTLYRGQPAWHQMDCDASGFEWIDCNDSQQSSLSFMRRSDDQELLFAMNFTPVPRHNYRVGVSGGTFYEEILNSNAELYGGSGIGNMGGAEVTPVNYHGKEQSVVITLPPLAMTVFQRLD